MMWSRRGVTEERGMGRREEESEKQDRQREKKRRSGEMKRKGNERFLGYLHVLSSACCR